MKTAGSETVRYLLFFHLKKGKTTDKGADREARGQTETFKGKRKGLCITLQPLISSQNLLQFHFLP